MKLPEKRNGSETLIATRRQPTAPAADRFDALERKLDAMQRDQALIIALLRRRRRVSPAFDGRLLGAIAATIGGDIFASSDLVRRAGHEPELRAVLGARDERKIGAWLRRLRGLRIGPYMLHGDDRDSRGTLWRVTVDTHIQASS